MQLWNDVKYCGILWNSVDYVIVCVLSLNNITNPTKQLEQSAS